MSKFDRRPSHKLGSVNIPSTRLQKPVETNKSDMGNLIQIETSPCPIEIVPEQNETNLDNDNASKVQDIIKDIEKKNKRLKKK